MKIMDDNFADYFEEENVPKEKVKDPEVETAEQRQEREMREVTIERRYDKQRLALAATGALLVIFALWWVCNRYFHVYETGSVRGCVMEMTNKGAIFKTYEGKMMTEKAYVDTVYNTDFQFTVRDDSIAAELGKLAGRGTKVELQYESYKGMLPWRGENNNVVVAYTLAP